MPRRRKKVRDLLSIADLDKRTASAREAARLRDQVIADRGGADQLSALELEQIENVTLTSTLVRSLQLRWLKGEAPSETERAIVPLLMTSLNTLNRLVDAIGAGRKPKDVTTFDAVVNRLNDDEGSS